MSQTLFEAASSLLERRYSPPVHSVAAALLTRDGEVITAVNIDHFSGFVCAETAALAIAINKGTYEFDKVVAVRKHEGGDTVIANMCGKCRQIFHDYAPGIEVISYDFENQSQQTCKIEDLLPYSFKKQQEKIGTVIGEFK